MCCFSVQDVFLEDPPPPKKKEEKVTKNYVLVSDEVNLQPITSPPPMYYPGSQHAFQPQFYSSQPAPESNNPNHYHGLTAPQLRDRNASIAPDHGGFDQVRLVPEKASPDNEYFCRELDGSWTVRTVNTIMNSLNPGQWAYATNGYPYWIRHEKK